MNGWRFTCGPRNFGRLFDLWMWRPTRTGTEVLVEMKMEHVPEDDAAIASAGGSPIVLNREEMQGHLADLQKLLGLAEDAPPIKIIRES